MNASTNFWAHTRVKEPGTTPAGRRPATASGRPTALADGFEIAFKHDFDDGTVVDARFRMIWIAPNLYRVETSGAVLGWLRVR